MSHNDHMFTALDDLAECMSLYSGFYSGVTLYLFCLASVISDFLAFFYNDLIAATS